MINMSRKVEKKQTAKNAAIITMNVRKCSWCVWKDRKRTTDSYVEAYRSEQF